MFQGNISQSLMFQSFLQQPGQVVTGVHTVLAHQRSSRLLIATRNRIRNCFVFIPNGFTHGRHLQHRPHGAANVLPMQLGTGRNQRVSAGLVDRSMKGFISGHHGFHAIAAGCRSALRSRPR